MADNNDSEDAGDNGSETIEVVPPEVLLPKVEKKEKMTKWLTYATLFVAVMLIATVGVGMMVMLNKISALELIAEKKENNSLDQQFDVLEERLALIAEFRKSELKKIGKFTKELEKLSSDCSAEKAEPFIKYLSQREQEFQKLIGLIGEGSDSLAGMNKGSRKWVQDQSKSLEILSKSSERRKIELDGLL